MRAVRLHEAGGPDQLALDEVEAPSPGRVDTLVRVHAASITRDELEWPTDRLPAIPSYELSGVVAAIGEAVQEVSVGDSVYALTGFDRDGAAADYALVRASVLAPKPRSLEHVESAALPLAGLSAWQGLFDRGRLEEGQRVLIHGATGGVGHLATQLARERGAYVIGTVSPVSTQSGEDLVGAHEVLAGTPDALAQLDPVDLVFDTVGGELLERSPALVRRGGRLVSVAEEPPGDSGVDSTYFVVEPSRDQLVELARLVDAGEVRPAIDSVFPLEDARAAFERSMAAGKRGKVVLRVADD
jgi:NADPH:quinone reductase-like Zn-dependent oxidoreductase